MIRYPGKKKKHLFVGRVRKFMYFLNLSGLQTGGESEAERISQSTKAGIFLLSLFCISHHAPFHQVLITDPSLAAVPVLSLISICL